VEHNTGAHHVQIDVTQAIPQIVAAIDHGGVESPSPERAGAMLAKVVVVGKLTLELLHESTEIAILFAHCSPVDMIAGDAEVQKRNAMFADCIS
jgi:hypothetical protein